MQKFLKVIAPEENFFMLKKASFYLIICSLISFLSFTTQPLHLDKNDWFFTNTTPDDAYMFPSQTETNYLRFNILSTKKLFVGFKEAVGFKESQGKYQKINSLGYMGKYQFGNSTLKSIGIKDSAAFLKNPTLQEKAFVALLAKNKAMLRDVISKFDGTTFKGIYITESGILAAAHLGGSGNVRKFFSTKNQHEFKDAYGTSVKSYLKKFSGYDTYFIRANSNAVASLD